MRKMRVYRCTKETRHRRDLNKYIITVSLLPALSSSSSRRVTFIFRMELQSSTARQAADSECVSSDRTACLAFHRQPLDGFVMDVPLLDVELLSYTLYENTYTLPAQGQGVARGVLVNISILSFRVVPRSFPLPPNHTQAPTSLQRHLGRFPRSHSLDPAPEGSG